MDPTTRAGASTSALHARLTAWYAAHRRDLPWRGDGTDAWGVLVSEVMLQQTPVSRVDPVWRAWMERWPTPSDLAAASPADVLVAWDRLGYPRRALRLRECATAIRDTCGGIVPDDETALLALPGIGPYTAAAVRAFAYGRRAVVLDTNVRRVLARALGGEALPAPSLTRAEQDRAAAHLPLDDAGSALWNVALMELGALVCTARSPRCDVCPLRELCAWRAAGHPPDVHAHRRRTQAWHGTDRQARGALMAVLRERRDVAPETLADAWPPPEQRRRALASLVADGLVVAVTDDDGAALSYALP
ncbi:HhH-GPD family protein [Beutenbergia cavernae DSM 12333]|uniref:Adenine DNA glycosylase n=1 Tax=Beutenbergia cavernae (strain ATCC BAA-8 / DSM 12333 / CCUG 43141 / JCM 11478 / NBRC 16432 / NCIMB 13614 / HKI 0122) TaxID=471853 RepID=C5C1B5_BEUC1|nr:A/G-specific adenine glycosylase [Beutenbergia cavernae]ACQ81525.1 HhH-GPD family protein [Beutenbergia cavernae DSM 12333]